MPVKLLSRVQLYEIPRTVAYQAPSSMEFSRQEYWSRWLTFPSPGDLPNTGIEPRSPSLQADALPSEPPGKPYPLVRHPQHPIPQVLLWPLLVLLLNSCSSIGICLFLFSSCSKLGLEWNLTLFSGPVARTIAWGEVLRRTLVFLQWENTHTISSHRMELQFLTGIDEPSLKARGIQGIQWNHILWEYPYRWVNVRFKSSSFSRQDTDTIA